MRKEGPDRSGTPSSAGATATRALVRRDRTDVESEVLAAEEAVPALQRRAGRDQAISDRVRDVKDAIKEALGRGR